MEPPSGFEPETYALRAQRASEAIERLRGRRKTGVSPVVGYLAGSRRQEVPEKSLAVTQVGLAKLNPQVKGMIKSRRHVGEVQGDGAGRAGGQHHRVLMEWALTCAFVFFSRVVP
ncbi:hypothetical protein [Streptomyces regalis]|uniref:hypothetical protein n=1 Tax=Streptomyces regalis TaxID=68262 RepID=UPI00131A8E93|nr:hypothetical protein [Streptomyces regalis]